MAGLSGKKHTTWWCATCGEEHDWKQPQRLLVVQTGDSVDQAKVFKAHAVPQGFCANLINALKLLPNQQKDGDGLFQNIVKDLGKESSEGLTHGLREFIRIDNKCALEVESLNQGRGTFKVRKPNVPEGCQQVTVRESPEELTLRAEEVGTWKSYINVDHTAPPVDYDWHALCQALHKGIEGEDWEDLYDSYKEMSRAVGVKKPQEGKMKAAKDAG